MCVCGRNAKRKSPAVRRGRILSDSLCSACRINRRIIDQLQLLPALFAAGVSGIFAYRVTSTDGPHCSITRLSADYHY